MNYISFFLDMVHNPKGTSFDALQLIGFNPTFILPFFQNFLKYAAIVEYFYSFEIFESHYFVTALIEVRTAIKAIIL